MSKVVTLPHNFNPREYQLPLFSCLERGYKRGIAVWHRRGGKDKVFINILAKEAFRRIGTYFYILPFYTQARLVVWEAMDKDGFRTRDHIPPSLVDRYNNQQMTMELKNGSFIRFLGSDNIDAIVGSNPVGVLFSEFSLHKIAAWDYLRPILIENGGWALFNGTPRGKNHMYHLYQKALANPNWFCEALTIEDTGVMSVEDVKEEIDNGMPEALAKQEFYVSWDAASVGSFYGDLINNRVFIGEVPADPDYPVNVAWDLGISDLFVLWFFQVIGSQVRIVKCYKNHSMGFEHYVNYIQSQPWVTGYHALPHDIKARELGRTDGQGRALSRLNTLRKMGLKDLRVMPKCSIEEGINCVRQLLPLCKFDAKNCYEGIEGLKDYRREWDREAQVFSNTPVHDLSSHYADAFRYLALSVKMNMGAENFMRPRHAVRGELYTPPGKASQTHARHGSQRFM